MKPNKAVVSEQGVPNMTDKVNSLCSSFFQNFDLNKLKYVWSTNYQCTDFTYPYCHLAAFSADKIDIFGPSIGLGFGVLLPGE